MKPIHFSKGNAWDTPTRIDQRLHPCSFKAFLLFLSLISTDLRIQQSIIRVGEKVPPHLVLSNLAHCASPPSVFHSAKLPPCKTGQSVMGFVNQSSAWPPLNFWDAVVCLLRSPATSSWLKARVSLQFLSFLPLVALDTVDHSCLLEGLSYLVCRTLTSPGFSPTSLVTPLLVHLFFSDLLILECSKTQCLNLSILAHFFGDLILFHGFKYYMCCYISNFNFQTLS